MGTNAAPPGGPPPPQQLAVTIAKQPRDVKDLLQSKEFADAVAMSLPRHCTVDRFVRIALNAYLRQPELRECSKESLFLAMLQLSSLGLEPDGRRAHLIPFWNNDICGACNHQKQEHRPKCTTCGCKESRSRRDIQLIIDYKGIAELVRRSGDVSYMHADVVYAKDEFDFKYGSDAFLHHKPNLMVEDRGAMIGAYSFVKLTDDNEDFIVMSMIEVDKIRSRSKAAKAGPWVTDFAEMSKKTVFRRHSKWLPLSPETHDAVTADDEPLAINPAGAIDLAAETIGTENLNRIERQMDEQSREANNDDKQPDRAASDVPAQGAPKAGDPPVNAKPWKDRNNMEAMFSVLRGIVGDVMYYNVLSFNGVGSTNEDLELNGTPTLTAYNDLLEASQGGREKTGAAGTQERDDEADFTPRNRRK